MNLRTDNRTICNGVIVIDESNFNWIVAQLPILILILLLIWLYNLAKAFLVC